MTLTPSQLWDRFRTHYFEFPTLGLSVDVSRMRFSKNDIETIQGHLPDAFKAMAELEAGAIANPDENRQVGHYWLRNPALAPTAAIRQEIEKMQRDVRDFGAKVQSGEVRGTNETFNHGLVIGIGGSALGPQFIAQALGNVSDPVHLSFLDNTDPDGIDRVLATLDNRLGRTLCIVISKSGGTKETRNGMLETKEAYRRAKLDFARHAVAVTGRDSELDKLAKSENWLARFPMWDWVGGRTSVTSAVGLLPAALQGLDIPGLLDGARACDEVTRKPNLESNPAAQLALMWHYAGQGMGLKDMVVIPYKDRLELFSKYLQQLVMESLGKELNLRKERVNQGLAVYGNKGSTDQHAYVQQLRDGIDNFFVTFIRVLREREGEPFMVEPDVTSGDYLDGFLLGTRKALFENGRESITLTIKDVSAFSVGVLIALYERAVGLYAALIEINAYHQPGVEAGKKAAAQILDLQTKVVAFLRSERGADHRLDSIAKAVGHGDDAETVFHILERLTVNPQRGIVKRSGEKVYDAQYSWVGK